MKSGHARVHPVLRSCVSRVAVTLRLLASCTFAAASAPHRTIPTKPIRVLVAQAAGGPTDVVTRIYAAKMSELLGQQMVVDNRPGAGGSVAGDIVARAPADGYTLCAAANGTIAIAPHFLKLSYSVTEGPRARSRSSATARSR